EESHGASIPTGPTASSAAGVQPQPSFDVQSGLGPVGSTAFVGAASAVSRALAPGSCRGCGSIGARPPHPGSTKGPVLRLPFVRGFVPPFAATAGSAGQGSPLAEVI